MNKKLYLMVGVAGSGKSTWLKNCANGVIVSRDNIRFEMLDKSDDYFAFENDVYEKFVADINSALTWGYIAKNVYADATHLTGKSRNKLLSRLDLQGAEIIVVFINTPLEKCIEQNNQREGRKKVPESVIRNQYSQLVKPTHNEKFKYKYIMEVT